MKLIVAAATDAARRDLADLVQATDLDVQAFAQDPVSLDNLLRLDAGLGVVTGGALIATRPFLSTARAANAPIVAVLSDRADSRDRRDLGYGGLALLRRTPRPETFRAAVNATRAGLSVWDPHLDSLATTSVILDTPLSRRERTVLQLTGSGLPTKSVARQLGISPNTVKFHLQAAFDKLGVTSRAEAVMAAIRRGELSV
jgi:DNA-binding NarL/FixJ family response regulator